MDLNNQIAVITGGASGMGKMCAQFLGQRGVRVVVWDKDVKGLKDSEIACDVSSAEDVEQALEITIANVGIPRICINCAGIAPAQRMVGKEGAMPLAAFKQVIDINLVGTFNVSRLVAHKMSQALPYRDEERGVIIHTASIAAFGATGPLG